MDTTIFAAPQGRIRNRLATTAMSLVLGFSLFGLAAGSAFAQTGPPGNNGTVKIHDGGTEPSPEVRNQPHVCTFHLHFFFADAAQAGAWWIRSWSPTGDGATVLTGTYLTDTNGEYRTPAEPGSYTLPDGHYKLFWEGRSSSNIKHKVFWVKCAATSGASGGATSGASGGAGSTENGSTGGKVEASNAMAQLKAAVRTEVSAEKAELAAVAGVQASIKAQLAASATTLTVLGAESAGAPSGNAGNSPAGSAGGTGGTGGTNGSGSAGAGAAANAAVGGAVAGVAVTPPPTDATTRTSQGDGTPLLPLILIVLVAVGVTVVSRTRFAPMRRMTR